MMYTMMNRPELLMNRMLRDFRPMPPQGPHHRPPMVFPVDMKKNADGYTLIAELPGVKLDDVTITVENDVLTIAVKVKRPSLAEGESYILRERRWGGCRSAVLERRFSLEGIDQNAITANCADGLLTITLPKEAPAEGKGPRRIAIDGGVVPAIEAPVE